MTIDNYLDVYTDETKTMIALTAALYHKLKAWRKIIAKATAILHRQALAIKKMPISLKNVFDEAVKFKNIEEPRLLSIGKS